MMIDFFGTLPGLLSLAGAAALLILVSVVRKLAARARTRRAQAGAGPAAAAPASPGFASAPATLPRWVVAAVAAWAALGEEPAPSAEAWKPAVSWHDPWLAAGWAGRRDVGVYK
jgi:hypothetical protein